MTDINIAFILPYFGKFDKLFPLWLISCKWNSNIDWLIFTDDETMYDYPTNVKVHYMSFADLRKKIQSLYDLPISLDSPYRLCNFKPAYGEIFEEYLKGYDAWGFCDNDMIYGQIIANIPSNSFENYKVGKYGHLSFIPNTYKSNRLYRLGDAYKIAFATPRPLFFDEGCFMKILSKFGYKEYSFHIADLLPRVKPHIVLNEEGREWMNEAHCFVWDKGKLWRYYVTKKNTIDKEEYVYIHFLKRPMEVDVNIELDRPIVIVPNKIFNIELSKITPSFLRRVSGKGIFWAYWKNSFRPRNFMERIKNRLYQKKRDVAMINKMEDMIDETNRMD